jgi:hypothetical protein
MAPSVVQPSVAAARVEEENPAKAMAIKTAKIF